jgi:ribonuclease HIII
MAVKIVSTAVAITSGASRLMARCTANLQSSKKLQQLIGIDVYGDGDVFGEWEFVECFAD